MAQLPPTPLEERYKDNGSLQHSCQNRLQSGVLHPKKIPTPREFLWYLFCDELYLHISTRSWSLKISCHKEKSTTGFSTLTPGVAPPHPRICEAFCDGPASHAKKKYGPRLEEAVRLERVLTYLNKNGVDATNCGAIYVPTIKKISGHAAVSTCTTRLLFYCSFRFHFTTS